MEKTIDGKELGVIILRNNLRAKHYSLRVIEGEIVATIPRGGSEQEVISFIEAKRERLIRMLHKTPKRPILNEFSNLQTYTFKLHIFRSSRTNFYMTLKEGKLHIACPEETNFDEEQTQGKLRMMLAKVLRTEALRILPSRLKIVASQYDFDYTGVSIRNTKTRWGSCNSKKQINLSVSLMLLPEHLIDYVLLHELCHTVEMNHGEQFWTLMDKVTNDSAKKLRRELKSYQLPYRI